MSRTNTKLTNVKSMKLTAWLLQQPASVVSKHTPRALAGVFNKAHDFQVLPRHVTAAADAADVKIKRSNRKKKVTRKRAVQRGQLMALIVLNFIERSEVAAHPDNLALLKSLAETSSATTMKPLVDIRGYGINPKRSFEDAEFAMAAAEEGEEYPGGEQLKLALEEEETNSAHDQYDEDEDEDEDEEQEGEE